MKSILLVLIIISSVSSFHLFGQNIDSTKRDTSFFQRLHYSHEKALMKKKINKNQRRELRIAKHSVHDTTNLNILKTNPLLFIAGVANISYERKLDKKISIESRFDYFYSAYISVGHKCTEPLLPFFQDIHEMMPVSGFSLSVGPKFYDNAYQAMSGFYFKPILRYKYYKSIKYNYESICYEAEQVEKRNNFGIKFIWGNQMIYSNNIVVDVFFGFGMRITDISTLTYYSIEYTQYDECQCDKTDFVETFDLSVSKKHNLAPTLHFGIKVGFAF